MLPNPPLNAYRVPAVLRDLVLVDMLELTGSTVAAAQVLKISQPNVSRRYRRLAAELGLRRDSTNRPGRRFSDTECIRLLRQGVNRHRLDCGVLRLGGPSALGPLVCQWPGVEWIPLPQGSLAHSDALLEHHLLDGVVLDPTSVVRQGSSDFLEFRLPVGNRELWLRCRPDPCVQQAMAQQLPQATR